MKLENLKVQALRPDREVTTRQRLPYFIGISGETVGARGLSMHIVVIPPGARAEPHMHIGYETGIYVLEGRVCTRWGPALEHEVVSEAGDFLFVPPGVPHEAINLSATESARAVVARNDPAEQDKVEPYSVTRSASGETLIRFARAALLRCLCRPRSGCRRRHERKSCARSTAKSAMAHRSANCSKPHRTRRHSRRVLQGAVSSPAHGHKRAAPGRPSGRP
jgi:uncharacterized RmlC-like cupin family protein